jgi:hypothetical protein
MWSTPIQSLIIGAFTALCVWTLTQFEPFNHGITAHVVDGYSAGCRTAGENRVFQAKGGAHETR